MFKELLNRLLEPAPARVGGEDSRLALCALLVRIARSDHNYADVEADRIDRINQARYGLDIGSAIILREQAEAMEAEAPDTVRFTRAIKDAVELDERIGVVEALWQVALGISTLLMHVPVALAAAHQGMALGLLSVILYLIFKLRRSVGR